MNQPPPLPFLVAGAGIGGLAAALALARAGRGVRIVEQRSRASETGAGIQIGPNGINILRRWGLLDQITAVAAEPVHIRLYDGASGRTLSTLPLEHMRARYGAPYLSLLRSDLHRILLEAVEAEFGIEMYAGFGVESVSSTRHEVEIGASDGRTLRGGALVAADGLWSGIATQVLGASRPRFLGKTAARLVVDASALHPPFSENAVGLWLGPHAHLVHYPVEAGRRINFVAVVDDRHALTDQPGAWSMPVDADLLLDAFVDWAPHVLEIFLSHTGWRRWLLHERAPLAHWCAERVAVLGDAAHPMLPFFAQGAVMALEDADALARAVQAAPGDAEAAFRAYDRSRRGRAQRVVEASRRNGRIYHASGPIALARNTVLRLSPGQTLMDRLDWLYRYGATRQPEPTAAVTAEQP